MQNISIHATRGGWRHARMMSIPIGIVDFNPRHPWRVATAKITKTIPMIFTKQTIYLYFLANLHKTQVKKFDT